MYESSANILHDNIVLHCFAQKDNDLSSGKSIVAHPGTKRGHLACCESGYPCLALPWRKPLRSTGQGRRREETE